MGNLGGDYCEYPNGFDCYKLCYFHRWPNTDSNGFAYKKDGFNYSRGNGFNRVEWHHAI